MDKAKSKKVVSYNKWGYIFLIPFVVVYCVFQLVPLASTFYNSLFENYRSGLTQVGPNFVGFQNYVKLFTNGEIFQDSDLPSEPDHGIRFCNAVLYTVF